jgi:hypothetical protein
MKGRIIAGLPWRRRGAASPPADAAKALKSAAREEQRQLAATQHREAAAAKALKSAAREEQRQLEATRRREAAARRRQVAGHLASAALSWGLNVWLESAMWLCLLAGLLVDYIASYADLAATFGAFGYDAWVRWIMPLGIDLPVTASVLGQLLAGRWNSRWHVRVRLALLTAVLAPMTLIGNALRGQIGPDGRFVNSFHVVIEMDMLAFAVPGLGVVLIGYVASMMQGERAEMERRRLLAEAEAEAESRRQPATTETDVEDTDVAPSSEPGDEPERDPNRPAREPARLIVRKLLKRHGNALTAERIRDRTDVSIQHARKLLRQERGLRVVRPEGRSATSATEVES